MSKLLGAAKKWAEAGFSIIPIRADGSKQPHTLALPEYFDEDEGKNKRGWKPFQRTLADDAQVQRWFGNGTARGIAIVWGAVSGNGEALDFDALGWYERFAALCEETENGELLERLPLVGTPTGGRHLLFRCTAPPPGNQKLAWEMRPIPAEAEWLEKSGREYVRFDGDEFPVKLDKDGKKRACVCGIETRGEGGYTLAPGSPPACHPDSMKDGGKPYRFLRGRPADIPTLTPEERGLLFALATMFNEWVEPEEIRDGPRLKKQGGKGTVMESGLRPGDDYNARGDYESVLSLTGWRRLPGGGDKGLWQRPGKLGKGISATSNYAGLGLFHVFSTNAAPFESNTSYSPFGVLTEIQCGGDYGAAAKALGAQGYGASTDTWKANQAQARADQSREKFAPPRADADAPPLSEADTAPISGADAPLTQEGLETAQGVADASARIEDAPARTAELELTDLGNAERLIARHGDQLRFSPALGWLVWTGKRWAIDESGGAYRLLFDTIRAIDAEAAVLLNEAAKLGLGAENVQKTDHLRARAAALMSHRKKSEAMARLEGALTLAEKLPGVYVGVSELDANPGRLNVENGTVNLETGVLQPHRPEDLITRICSVPYLPQARALHWERCLHRWQPDAEMRAFLQRAAGYSLTGYTGEETAFLLYGLGRNGKSKFTGALEYVLGSYAGRAPIEIFLDKGRRVSEGPTPDKADLAGKRLVIASELKQSARLDENFIKDVTGGDTMTAAKKYKDPFTFKPALKLWLYGNHRPQIIGVDAGIKSRLPLIPFTVEIPKEERDRELDAKLRAEETGILAWAVAGCLEWKKRGLDPPAAVVEATAAYHAGMDTLAGFFQMECVFSPRAWTPARDLREALKRWADGEGIEQISSPEFGERLTQANCRSTTRRMNGKVVRIWEGIGLISAALASSVTGVTDCNSEIGKTCHINSFIRDFSENDVTAVTPVTYSEKAEFGAESVTATNERHAAAEVF